MNFRFISSLAIEDGLVIPKVVSLVSELTKMRRRTCLSVRVWLRDGHIALLLIRFQHSAFE
jgi:hypothetical protein